MMMTPVRPAVLRVERYVHVEFLTRISSPNYFPMAWQFSCFTSYHYIFYTSQGKGGSKGSSGDDDDDDDDSSGGSSKGGKVRVVFKCIFNSAGE